MQDQLYFSDPLCYQKYDGLQNPLKMFRHSLIKLIVTTKDFGIWMTFYRQKFTLCWPGNWILSEKRLKLSKIWTIYGKILLWRVLDVKLYTPSQLLVHIVKRFKWAIWKVGGNEIEGTKKLTEKQIFSKNTLYPKFFKGNFFGDGTHVILRHLRFRICLLKGSHELLCPPYTRPKSGDA